ncbi:hypothetical protein H257_10357 [Aphanomyces astaci]|uniref:Crinkler effector protein N-terminal domain-containing protein n=1 Tax=Aphanomyces astaci TaxID=112090 RepID=W4G767_APHAT|nr:hypothetical protein H257_10357 [Aphanomyces astaci]ETV75542.1 hypothetical protein H257_10357 [Aphanomyces astaci]|eukprot:XP_009835176.1 hypothetical protein H257_10357 [Aphanomyces astaci]
MKSLVYMVIPDGSIFGVKVKDDQQVYQLEKMIQDDNPYSIGVTAIKLYLAKKDGEWLTTDDDEVKVMRAGQVHQTIKDMTRQGNAMDRARPVGDAAFSFPSYVTTGTIHVLVDVPMLPGTPGATSQGVIESGAIVVFFKRAAQDGVVVVGGDQLAMIFLDLVDVDIRPEAKNALTTRVQHITNEVGRPKSNQMTRTAALSATSKRSKQSRAIKRVNGLKYLTSTRLLRFRDPSSVISTLLRPSKVLKLHRTIGLPSWSLETISRPNSNSA